jgi:hypothetical protein
MISRSAEETAKLHQELEAIAKQQGKQPVKHIEDLYGDFWPEDETADDFVKTMRQWRNEGREQGK